ncbi:16S rRNA (cytosine(1402)-N(4))-methyltransferase RsmH [Flavisolibacter ginsengisoli]|jgi:16S rRNA (cytosine1402-N4)-methyltransferase|uniref:Ribosomal RNA small subunit methyltransferase H n=1 Tax=Flavisolibacter ginsengisoli DSM 18119 TaxID=1121884 RepID=A0A1M5CSE5_9BACT|nr:16S rRNA (cytosine(1402)-N(4))-methyltransferase RsmH [Flavisolibacter ginsengisoli]SHF57620.1 16S rRNA (cytosine1402-N4)-methyltransferase [Flavisolibacter ginsengisoli DSM 18119]
MNEAYHIPVLLDEVIENLNIKPNGIYVDCTFGGGGHSRMILEKLGENGRLVAFDQDADARKNVPADDRVLFVPQNFRHLQRFLKLNGIEKVDGLLADLGVSSHQFDEGERGFSTRYDAPMDMRMDQRQTKTAYDVVSEYSEQQLHKLFEQYGEVTNAKTLARTIVEVRKTTSLKTINGFKAGVSGVVKGNPNKYFAQVFQALRIEVNDEMGALKELLVQLPVVLKPGARVAIITFHSIEDRLVKVYFRDNSFDLSEDNPFTMSEKEVTLKPVNKKPIVASQQELKRNPRSRSAKLRVAERV